MRVIQDFNYALRQIRRSPGFAAMVVSSLGLGIGASIVMFAIVYGVLLHPLPFHESGHLYLPVGGDPGSGESLSVPYPEIQSWTVSTHGEAEIAFSDQSLGILDTPAGATLVLKVSTSPTLFSMLGVRPILGRTFLANEQEQANTHVVLIGDAMWRQEFSAMPDVLGKTVHLNGIPYTIVGVMSDKFAYPVYGNRAEVWTPLEQESATAGRYEPIVRIPSAAFVSTVQSQLQSVHAHMSETSNLESNQSERFRLTSLHQHLVAGVRPALTALEIAVALLWSIACFNAAGLFLARISRRQSETAVRVALGASKSHLVWRFLVESLSLSSVGAIVGFGMAVIILQLFRHLFGKILPLSENVHMDWPVLLVAIGLTLATALVFGILPAAVATNSPLAQGLKSGGKNSSTDRTQQNLRRFLVIGEIAVSLALLIGAGLMMRTMYALRHVDLGFRADRIMLTALTVPGYRYSGRNLNFVAWEPLLNAVRQLQGVENAALSTVVPIEHTVELQTVVEATEWTPGNVSAVVRAASPELASVLGIQIRTGRFFTALDTADTPPVMVVNRSFVDHYLGGKNAIGRKIRFGRARSVASIVGVIDDVHQDSVWGPSQPEMYLCMAQLTPTDPLYVPLIGRFMELAIRTQSSPKPMIQQLRIGIRQINSNLAPGESITMTDAIEDSLSGQHLAANVIVIFGTLALLITVVGVYGLFSYSVTLRTREIGIRMALGADRSRVIGMIFREATIMLLIGLGVGLPLSFWCTSLLRQFLFGVKLNDPWTSVTAPVVLLLCGILATLSPARRASAIEPIQALRAE